jgi:hypothetical protein
MWRKELSMKLGLDTSRPAIVPLRDAMLCTECEFVTPASSGKCSICGGNKLVMLSALLELLVKQACGANAPVRLVELACMIAANKSIQHPDSPQRHQEEPSPFELSQSFEAFVEENHSCSSPSQTTPALDSVSPRNITVSLPRRSRKKGDGL